MADPTTITDFLLARIAEDETAAREANDLAWAFPPPDGMHEEWRWTRIIRSDGSGRAMASTIEPGAPSPARVLAECEAKRAIMARHAARDISPSCSECGGYSSGMDSVRGIVHSGYAVPWPCPTVRALALPYRDHPDFQQEWA